MAPLSITLLASGFDGSGQQLIVLMIRVLAPTVLLIGLWGILKTLLNAEGEFFVSTISQALQSVGIIAAVLLFVPKVGIFSLPLGILIAAALQVLWTGYWLKRKGFQHQWKIDLSNPEFRYYLSLLGPTVIGGFIVYIEPILDKSLASHLAEGTVASLSFAGRPMALLTRVVVYSFVTALLPSLAWTMTHRGRESFRASVVQILNMLMFVIIPVSVLLIALRVPIIQVLFERGRFEATATAATANIFAGLVIGLLPLAVTVTLSTVFISLEDTTTPALWGAGSSFLAKIVFSLILLAPLGAGGLALATSFKSMVASTLLLLRLRRRLQGIDGRYLITAFGRILLVSCVAVSPVYWMTLTLDLSPVLLTVTGASIATILYVGLSMLLQAPEVALVQSYLRSKRA
jgi:putative peptidoglycan lipid II flippase